MRPTRVLIVDDSAAVRRLLTDTLAADPQIEVVGAVGEAALALDRIARTPPDLVTLDVEMPDVNGIELLGRIRKAAPRLPVIMFSALTQRAAAITLEALALGATDYVTKPAGTGSREASIAHVRAELIPRIKALGRPDERGPAASATPRPPLGAPAARPRSSAVRLLAIGCSTGGPNALGELFRALPADFPVPIVIVQHMPPVFTQLLAERLTATCPLTFHEAKDGDVLAPGGVWIAPGDHHMRVVGDGTRLKVTLNRDPPEHSCRPAVDVLFRSIAELGGGDTLAVVLTGMGQDGLKGCEQLHALGARIVVQDEKTSVVWGMPGFIARAGLADRVLPLGEIAMEIERHVPRAPIGVGAMRAERSHAG